MVCPLMIPAWESAAIIIGELYALGVRRFVYASGARSAPLIVALYLLEDLVFSQKHAAKPAPVSTEKYSTTTIVRPPSPSLSYGGSDRSGFKLRKHFDERGAVFYALGLVRAEGEPVAVILTSGSALANAMPAVSEAAKGELPLLILTADRPAALQGIRCNQTIDQDNFFKPLALASYTLSLEKTRGKEERTQIIEELTLGVERALAVNMQGPPGVVHFNIPFSKPLVGAWEEEMSTWFRKKIAEQDDDSLPLPSLSLPRLPALCAQEEPLCASEKRTLHEMAKGITEVVGQGKRLLIVLGVLDAMPEAQKTMIIRLIGVLSQTLSIPIYSELYTPRACELQQDGKLEGHWIENFPLLLEHWGKGSFGKAVTGIIHLGGETISQAWLGWLQRSPPAYYWHIERLQAHYDPAKILDTTSYWSKLSHRPLPLLHGLLTEVKEAFSKLSEGKEREEKESLKWLRELGDQNIRMKRLMAENFSVERAAGRLSEWVVMDAIKKFSRSDKMATEKWSLFLGNSMPVRSWTLLGGEDSFRDVFVSRGTSGIDGLLAMACGIADTLGPSVLDQDDQRELLRHGSLLAVLGDLTVLHDLNALTLLRDKRLSHVGIVVINNHEGTIFNHLRLRPFMEKHWEEFIFRHEFSFQGIAEMVGIAYACVTTEAALAEALQTFSHSRAPFLIEVEIDGEASLEAHRSFLQMATKL